MSDAPDWESFLTLAEFEAAARAALPRPAWEYFRAGADEERTLRRNQAAFDEREIWPRVLVDVATRRLASTLYGAELEAPILVAPTAYHRLAHPDGELATARAATSAGSIYVVSTLATTPLEEVAAAATGPKWFQLYVHRDRAFSRALVERAERAGYRALVLTVDTPILGRRLYDERTRFQLPDGLHAENLGAPPAGHAGSSLSAWFAARHDASLSWDALGWLRSITKLPILLKGVLRADDAERAVAAGAAGVIVSNHGGRQLDGVPATIDALPAVARGVGGRVPVLLDGGVRRGTDVLIALSLGAQAVLVGRPVLWGLAVAGERGAARVLGLLAEELSRAMALAGCAALESIPPDLTARRPTPA